MADIAQAVPTAVSSEEMESTPMKFVGSYRNLVPGLALIVAGLLAPVMGLTDVFFAAAMAWVFVLWGLFFIYMGLIDIYKSYEITDDSLIITDPFRFWNFKKEWDWANVFRVDIKVEQPDARIQDAKLQIYYSIPDGVDVEREDRDYDPRIAEAVIDRAQLSPEDNDIDDLTNLPFGVKGNYSWRK